MYPFKINGEEIVDTNIYHVATTTFLALGGDGFLAFKKEKCPGPRGNNMSNVVIDSFLRKATRLLLHR